MGIRVVENCNLLQLQNQDELEEYMDSANFLNRIYGLVVVLVLVVVLCPVVYYGMNYYKTPSFLSFGRRAKCRLNNKVKGRR